MRAPPDQEERITGWRCLGIWLGFYGAGLCLALAFVSAVGALVASAISFLSH